MLYHNHGADTVLMACELAFEYGTMQLSAIIALVHDLAEPQDANELAEAERSFPPLALPPQADCQRYDQLLSSGGVA